MRSIVRLALAIGVLLLFPTVGSANVFEKLVMPGEVIEGHAKLEDKCENCHEPFSKESQARLCLACHKDVATDIDGGRGFHGKRPDIKGTECKHCHTDHKGRGEDIVRLDREIFDHAITDFPLLGSHAKVKCANCHEPKRKLRDAPGQCNDCHKSDDPHRGRLGEVCADCHDTEQWPKARFDHGKTKFALEGAHKKTDCKSCHAGERYKETPTKCASCHRLDDAHGGRYGDKCESCHSAKAWKDAVFDHTRKTSFPLAGKHEAVRCDACHTGDLYKQKLAKTCISCHRADDEHKGRNGEKCESCHTAQDWRKVGFDHDKDTKFALKGKHTRLKCQDCHQGDVYTEKLDKACVACHRTDDVHKGSLGPACATCHTPDDWKKTAFDHNKDTKFPLRERHANLTCQACHKGPDPKTEKLGTGCKDCHKKDDVHKGQEGETCENCHNVRGWGEGVFFDHDLTRFPLVGLHATTPCEECHLTPAYKDTDTACASCHRPDDVHKGGLGAKCALCHNPNGWAFWQFDHDTQTDYRLDGGHQGLVCRACHKDPVKNEISLPTACVGCHRRDDVHRGRFGNRCERCHVTDSFTRIK